MGGNLLSNVTSKSISKNEIEELKEIAKQEAKQSGKDPNAYSVVNPETLFYSLKQLGETLGLNN